MNAHAWTWRRRAPLRYAAARTEPVREAQGAADSETRMLEREIELVRDSYARLEEPLAFGRRFYAHLFAARPDVRRLFPADLDAQVRKLVDMLGAIVNALDEPARLHDQFATLGRRHAGYGVDEEDYDDVGAALLKALRESFGGAFTGELEAAWGEVYGELAEAMIAAQGERAGATVR